MRPLKILISAGEASGDLYASKLIAALREFAPSAEYFGCAGPRMRADGVRTVVRSESLSVVGLVEVIASRDVSVTAVYTTGRSLDVKTVQGHLV